MRHMSDCVCFFFWQAEHEPPVRAERLFPGLCRVSVRQSASRRTEGPNGLAAAKSTSYM